MSRKSDVQRNASDRALRMLALQIIQQLPEDQVEAHKVLRYAKDELDRFVFAEAPVASERKPLRVV